MTANEEPLLLRADDVPLDVIGSLGQDVVAAVGEKRSTWHRWNLTAEAARQTMGYRFASTEDREAVIGLVVDAAEAELHDGTRAAAGDTVITRRNDRRLRAGRSWVRNGDRWTVTEVRDDGSLTIRRTGRKWGGSVVLPAEYAAERSTRPWPPQHNTTAGRSSSGHPGSGDEADDAIGSPAFGALTAELRRAEANQHDVEALLPRLVRARGFGDAEDIAAVLHYRVTRATARPAGSGRARMAPRLIAGLIPEATGTMPSEMRRALSERRDLIEARAAALLGTALNDAAPWTTALGPGPKEAKQATIWRRAATVVAAYRDRYSITGPGPLGAPAESEAQKIDAARARAAVDRARDLARVEREEQERTRRSGSQRVGPSL